MRTSAILTLTLTPLVVAGCESAERPHSIASDPASRSPLVGRAFPEVRGTGLDKREWKVPGDMLKDDQGKPRPVLLLVGYVQDAQFDIDRWTLGLAQAKTPGAVFELPCVRGWLIRQFSSQLDSGMRRGIPKENWGAVVTVYGDASKVSDFTGDEHANNARVILLKPDGTVAWFWDEGYSPTRLIELDAAIRAMTPAGG